MKRAMKGVLALALMLGFGVREAGAVNPDMLTITITPVVTLDVVVDTGTVLWNSGDADLDLTLALGTTDFLIRPGTMTVSTNFADTEIDVDGLDNMTDWTFDTSAPSVETDALQVYLLMSDTVQFIPPTLANFTDGTAAEGDQVVDTGARRYGLSGSDSAGNDNAYQEFDFNDASENLNNNDERHLWVRVDLPVTSSVTTLQRFSIALTAVAAN